MHLRRNVVVSLLGVLAAGAAPAPPSAALPDGWFKTGGDPASYEAALDPEAMREGHATLRLKAIGTPRKFATVMKKIEAESYRGKKLRLSALVKMDQVEEGAGLWMRIDGTERRALAFDNMMDRPLKGSSDWARHEVVLPVDASAEWVAYGLLQRGPGTTWIDDVRLDIVPDATPVTGGPKPLTNLGFDE